MAITNCLLSVPRFGTIKLKAEYVTHGMQAFAIGVGEDESRTAKQFFTTHVTSDSFDLGVVFTTYAAADNFMKWTERYMRWMADARAPGSPARVKIPSRRFDKTGVMTKGVRYGDKAGQYVYRAELTFVGSRDPVDLKEGSALTSYFTAAVDQELVWLYPSGSGLAPPSSWNALSSAPDPNYQGRRPRLGGP